MVLSPSWVERDLTPRGYAARPVRLGRLRPWGYACTWVRVTSAACAAPRDLAGHGAALVELHVLFAAEKLRHHADTVEVVLSATLAGDVPPGGGALTPCGPGYDASPDTPNPRAVGTVLRPRTALGLSHRFSAG